MSDRRSSGMIFDSGYTKGFSRIEWVIAIAIIGTLLGVFLNRIWYYQEIAEKAAMQEEVGAIQSALSLRLVKDYVRGNREGVNLVVTENPINWLQRPPDNYAGEYFDPVPQALSPGNWVFDLKARELIYVPGQSAHFLPGKDGRGWIRFHIKPQILADSVDVGGKEKSGAVFEPKEPLTWF